MPPRLDDALEIYRDYLHQIDDFCDELATAHADQIVCRAGCAGCCTAISLLPVEAAALASAFLALPADRQSSLRREAADSSEPCPLLKDSRCLLYLGRPLICRTHGFPLMLRGEQGERIDCCRLNFTGDASALCGEAVLDLEALNEGLASINSIFLHELGLDDLAGKRLTLLEAIGEAFLDRLKPLITTN